MTDTNTTGETPPELAPPILPAPELAEVEAAPATAPAPQADAPGDAPAERVGSSLRQAVIDALVDNERPLTVAEIIAHLPVGVSRNTAESAIKRAYDAGLIERVSPGVYKVAPEKPAEPAKPSPDPEPVRSDGMTNQDWFDALEKFFADPNGSTWDAGRFGPPPDQRPNRIPPDVAMRFNDRLRKREERRKDREAAAAKLAAADDALRNRLFAGCFNNVMLGAPGIDDLAPVKAMLADGVPMNFVLIGLQRVTDRRIDPRFAPIASWRDERFLRAVARCASLEGLFPKLVEAWAKAGTAPQQLASASETSSAISELAAPATAPAPPLANAIAPSGEFGEEAAALRRQFGRSDTQAVAQAGKDGGGATAAAPYAVEGRESIMATFQRNRQR